MSVVGGQPKKPQVPVIKQQNTSNALFQYPIITSFIGSFSSPNYNYY